MTKVAVVRGISAGIVETTIKRFIEQGYPTYARSAAPRPHGES
jgi:hypothetical protein